MSSNSSSSVANRLARTIRNATYESIGGGYVSNNNSNNYYLPNNINTIRNKSLLNKMKNAFGRFKPLTIGPFGLTARIQAVLRTNMPPGEKVKAVQILLRGNKRRSSQNKLKLVTEVLNSNFSKNPSVRNAIVNYLSSSTNTIAPRVGWKPNIGSLLAGKKSRFEEVLTSTTRNSRSKAQELSYLLRSDPTNLNKKARLIGNATNLKANNRDDLFDLITTIKEEQLENRNRRSRRGGGFRPGLSSSIFNSIGKGSSSSSSAPIEFQRQVPYTGNGGPLFGGARNERRVESSSGFGRNNGGGGFVASPPPPRNNGAFVNNGGGTQRNNGAFVNNGGGTQRNNGAFVNNGGGTQRNNGGAGAFVNNGGLIRRNNNGNLVIRRNNQNIMNKKKKRCRPVKMKLLKGVVSDVNKKKLVRQVKKLGKEDAKKQKKDDLIKFIIRRIRPPVPKKKKKRVQEPVKENQGLIFRNALQVNGAGTGNQGLRPANVRNTTRNGFIP